MTPTLAFVEPAILQIVVNGGAFALLAVLVLWWIFKGQPAAEERLARAQDLYLSAIAEQRAEFKAELKTIRDEHRQERDEWARILADHRNSIHENTKAIERQQEICRTKAS